MSFAMYSSSKVDYGEHDSALKQYQERGTERALAMTNRGPVRYDPDGRLHQNILDEYRRNGFYVFTEVLEETSYNTNREINPWALVPAAKSSNLAFLYSVVRVPSGG